VRAKEDIQKELDECKANIEHSDLFDQDLAFQQGMQRGLERALELHQDELASLAIRIGENYVSIGNDWEDAWQNGCEAATKWAAGLIEWES
jgi:DNA-directed RNA polymerase specialized sigma24 family protein